MIKARGIYFITFIEQISDIPDHEPTSMQRLTDVDEEKEVCQDRSN